MRLKRCLFLTATGSILTVSFLFLRTCSFNPNIWLLDWDGGRCETLADLGGIEHPDWSDEIGRHEIATVDFDARRGTRGDLRCLDAFPQLRRLSISGPNISPSEARQIAKQIHLRELYLRDAEIDVAALAPLKRLWGLHLNDMRFGDHGLKQLPDFPELRLLEINISEVSDAGLRELGRYSNLREIKLFGTKRVTGEGFSHLKNLKSLRVLGIDSDILSSKGLLAISQLESLEELNLYRSPVSDDGLEHLSRMRRLRILSMDGKRITDVGVAHLVKLEQLTNLGIWDAQVTDASVDQLLKLSNLHGLDLNGAKFSPAGRERLKQGLRAGTWMRD